MSSPWSGRLQLDVRDLINSVQLQLDVRIVVQTPEGFSPMNAPERGLKPGMFLDITKSIDVPVLTQPMKVEFIDVQFSHGLFSWWIGRATRLFGL